MTDQKGCFTTRDTTVLEPDALLIASMSMDSASCNGVADGTATANGITGGNGITVSVGIQLRYRLRIQLQDWLLGIIQ